MKLFIVLSAFAAVAMAKPGHLLVDDHHANHIALPIVYAKLVPGAPIGPDGRVVDTPEVAIAKAEHEAAHINEKINLAHETVKSADFVTYAAAPVHSYHTVAPVAYAKLVSGAPIGHDGRVVDTPEVAYAKAEHAAARINEKINLAHEEAKSSSYRVSPQVHHLPSAYSTGSYGPHYYGAHHSAPLIALY